MSANLSRNLKNEVEMFCAGEPAWHNLGTNVSEAQTWQQASKLAKLDWSISKVQLSNPRLGSAIPSYALLRDDDDRYLATVGEKYFPIQNQDAFSFCDALLKTGDAHYESAGALGNGEIMWCLARINKEFAPVKGDDHKTYLLFSEFRDGRAAQVKLTTTRVVCNNTLNVALRENNANNAVLKLRHTGNVENKIIAAKALLKTVDNEIENLNAKLKALASKKVTKESFKEVMDKLFPNWDEKGRSQNKVASIVANFQSNDSGMIKGIEGTAYALLQSITRYTDHQRDGLRIGDSSLDVKRAESAMFGSGDAFKASALERICEAVGIIEANEDNTSIDKILNSISL